MPYNSNVNITFRGIQGGQICENHLEYHALTAVSGDYADLVADYAYGAWWLAMQALVCDEFELLQIGVRTVDALPGGTSVQDWLLDVGELGTNIGQPMPPNVTVRMVKVVDNDTRDPIGATAFRNGFTGWSGFPEDIQDNGLLTSGGRASWQALADAMLTLEVTIAATPYEWTLGLERGTLSPVKAVCSSVNVSQRVGTRNSRKR